MKLLYEVDFDENTKIRVWEKEPEDTVQIKLPVEAMNLLKEHARALGKTPEETLKEILLTEIEEVKAE